ncbi:MAG: hypothetical protein H0T86_12285 [Gemmatimonadales bacterium]|nr:hypothetical protein [Gemmatimonadales bacterium]
MTRRQAGLLLTALHVAMLGTLGLKLVADRARLPRAWARTQPYDPSTPLRGRYVKLALEIPLTTGGSARGGVGDRGGASARWMESSWARSTTR